MLREKVLGMHLLLQIGKRSLQQVVNKIPKASSLPQSSHAVTVSLFWLKQPKIVELQHSLMIIFLQNDKLKSGTY